MVIPKVDSIMKVVVESMFIVQNISSKRAFGHNGPWTNNKFKGHTH